MNTEKTENTHTDACPNEQKVEYVATAYGKMKKTQLTEAENAFVRALAYAIERWKNEAFGYTFDYATIRYYSEEVVTKTMDVSFLDAYLQRDLTDEDDPQELAEKYFYFFRKDLNVQGVFE